jgi:hypothetical protein
MLIEYAFVTSITASFSVVGIAGLFFGFRLGQWTELQGILVGALATIAGIVGACLGLHIAFGTDSMKPGLHSNDNKS